MAKQPTPREQALSEVAQHEETLARWEAEHTAATVELQDLQNRAGEEVLADANAGSRLVGEMQRLRDRIDIAQRATVAARSHLDVARRAAILAEAEEWDAEAEKRQRILDVHEARTAELLEQLLQHEGRFISVQEAEARLPSTAPGVSILDGAPVLKSAALAAKVEEARRTALILRAIADGEDPRTVPALQSATAADYPASVWGPTAVLPAPAYADTVASAGA